jgi:cellobiose phosphorylase
MTQSYGRFDDASSSYVIENPLTPRPWINYLTNRRLRAFISQNAGGPVWYHEPLFRRISRYHYLPTPEDQPGLYVYVRDDSTGRLWNPHYAPTRVALDRYVCRHEPGVTSFQAAKDGLSLEVSYFIPPDDDVLIWRVQARASTARTVQLTSYLEFGLLEFQRELYWAYLKSHNRFGFDAGLNAIRYEYGVFEAPYRPAMLMGAATPVAAYECGRDAFVGRGGSLADPAALRPGQGLANGELPEGGHGCGALGIRAALRPGEVFQTAFVLSMAETWPAAEAALRKYQQASEADAALARTRQWWAQRRGFRAHSGEPAMDRFINTWGAHNTLITCELARTISTDHPGVDGLRFRDTAQDALGVAGLDAEFAADRLRLILAQQHSDGSGCMAFYPHTQRPTVTAPDRSDNGVWTVYTTWQLLCETGDLSLLRESIEYRDGGRGTVFDHLQRGLAFIDRRRGPHGLPIVADADWNDGLALFEDRAAGSILNSMMLVHALRLLADMADLLADEPGAAAAGEWCRQLVAREVAMLNQPPCWDGSWYSRLVLSNGKVVGSAAREQGRVFLNPQAWSIIAGVASPQRAALALQALREHLDTPVGLRILSPSYRGFPEPQDPPKGSRPGTNENGAIFCHANTWAIIAATLAGEADLAYKWFTQMLPENVARRMGEDHYEREPYVCVSTILGPDAKAFGRGGISWLSGTAAWLYVAVTQHILGVRPGIQGLTVRPCLPASVGQVELTRRFRGRDYHITLTAPDGDKPRQVLVDGRPTTGLINAGSARPSAR